MPNADIIDPDDFCRACRGKGLVSHEERPIGHGPKITYERCFDCRGTGRRTILVLNPAPPPPRAADATGEAFTPSPFPVASNFLHPRSRSEDIARFTLTRRDT